MRKVFEYAKLVVFFAGVLIGVQVPGFVDQYGKSLESRFYESEKSKGEFQDNANKYFGGDIDKLIEHYNKKNDPVIVAGGDSISAIFIRNKELKNALSDFAQSIYSPYLHVVLHPVEEIKINVWKNYTHNISFNKSAITFGLLSGVLFLALFELIIFLSVIIYRVFNNSGKKSSVNAASS